MKNINIIANNVVLLNEHIIETLKGVGKTSNLKNVISDCITYHKDCYNSIINFIIDHGVPGNVVYNLILEVISSESIKKHRLDCRLENIKRVL